MLLEILCDAVVVGRRLCCVVVCQRHTELNMEKNGSRIPYARASNGFDMHRNRNVYSKITRRYAKSASTEYGRESEKNGNIQNFIGLSEHRVECMHVVCGFGFGFGYDKHIMILFVRLLSKVIEFRIRK